MLYVKIQQPNVRRTWSYTGQQLTVRQRFSALIDRRKTVVQSNAVTFFNPAFQMPEGEFSGNEAPTTSSAFAQFKGKFSLKQSFAQFKEKLPNPKQSLTTAFNKLRQLKQKVASPNEEFMRYAEAG